jgi:hypothetical protein
LAKPRTATARRITKRTAGGPVADPVSAVKTALRALARRWQALQAEIDDLDTHLTSLVVAAAPALVALPGVGVGDRGARPRPRSCAASSATSPAKSSPHLLAAAPGQAMRDG